MKKLLSLILALTLVFTLAACGGSSEPSSSEPAPEESASAPAPEESASAPAPEGEPTVADKVAAAADAPVDTSKVAEAVAAGTFKIGVILVGDENEGYTFSHIEGIEATKKALGLKDEQVIYKYSIPEDETCYDTAVDLAEQGCSIIFSNSFSHETYMVQAATEYPDIIFLPATGQQAALAGLNNVVNYFPDIYESRYVAGVVAGMKLKELMDAGTVTEPKIGYVGAYPYAEVVSGYTAFFLGIRSIVPEATMEVTYTNSWFDITAEAEAANSLVSRGCVIIGQHADSTGAPSACEALLKAGTTVYSVGYNIDMLTVAPTAALTSAQNCWDVLYTDIIGKAMKGEAIPKNCHAGYPTNGVKISALGASCAAGTAEKVADIVSKISSEELHVFDCSTWTVEGKNLDSYDKAWGFEGIQLISDGYFHESEVIAAPLFDIRVDGITELN